MNIKKINMAGAAIFAAAALLLSVASCTKESGKVAGYQTNLANKSKVQVFVGTLGATRNYVYVDGVPVTGAGLVYNSLFPSSSNSFAVDAGLRGFLIKDTLGTSVQTPIVFSQDLQANSGYTIFTYDTLNAAKQITVPTVITVPTDTTARVRFANLAYAKTAVPAVDIFSVRRQGNLFTNISATQVTDFIPLASAISDTLVVRQTGTTVNLDTLRGFTPTQKRSYTLVFIGRYNANESVDKVLPRTLTVFANY